MVLIVAGTCLLVFGFPLGWMMLFSLQSVFTTCEPFGPLNCWDFTADPNNAADVPNAAFMISLTFVILGILFVLIALRLQFRRATKLTESDRDKLYLGIQHKVV
jgi:hypothetical protein